MTRDRSKSMHLDRGKLFELFTNTFFDRSTGNDLRAILERTAVSLCDRLFKDIGAPYWFTDHGPQHSDTVLYNAILLAQQVQPSVGRFTPQEGMCLGAACYLHDIGMAHLPTRYNLKNGWTRTLIDKVPAWHVGAVVELLPRYKQELKPLYDFHPLLEEALPLVCTAHGTKAHLKTCSKLRDGRDDAVQGDLLAKLLLLADELDLDYRRASLDKPQSPQFPATAQAHQYKHHYVVQVRPRLPLIDIDFAFPEDLPQGDRSAFMEWVCGKLRNQLSLATRDMVAKYKEAFDFVVRNQERSPKITRLPCPQEVCRLVRKLSGKTAADAHLRPSPQDRPNHFHPSRTKPREPGPLYPVLDRLMDEFFREGDTRLASEFFENMYIRLPDNCKVAEELLKRVDAFGRALRRRRRSHIAAQHPFLITGRTGSGKSALVRHLMATRRLRSDLSSSRHMSMVIHIDCLAFTSFEEVARQMLQNLATECRKSAILWQALDKDAWTEKLKVSRVVSMHATTVISILRAVLELLHERSSKHYRAVCPVVYVLDNVDRMPGFDLKRRIMEFVAKEGKRGYPFFVVTIRNSTKAQVDRLTDELSNSPTNDIVAAGPSAVLHARLEAAFSDRVLGKAESWCEPQEVQSVLGEMGLSFSDLRPILKAAIYTLAMDNTARHEPLIPGLAGANMRNALTLYRAIMKSVSVKELFTLSKGARREHYLIKTGALERHPCYFASRSKIRNVFDPVISGFYFVKLYSVRILDWLQVSLGQGEYVTLKAWLSCASDCGMPKDGCRREMWDIMTGDFPLVELEGSDETLPDDKYGHMEDLQEDIGLRLSPAGAYYLRWLLHDVSYLECVLQDTLMDVELAQKLGTESPKLPEMLAKVEQFVRFLIQHENMERAGWRVDSIVRPIMPVVQQRVKLQAQAMIARSSQQ
jgi:hypothetical protein